MGFDLIEIAVSKMTDADGFEKLATDILYLEGHTGITPMPGGNDFGQDAIDDKFYESSGKSTRTVYQYTLQENAKTKIKKTIARLQEAKIDFNELIYVTNREVTGEIQEGLKKEIRAQYGIPLSFVEKSTIVNRLSDLRNGLFYRYFPDPEKQLAVLKNSKPIISSDDYEKALQTSLLKISIAFTFNDGAKKARKDVFDNLILSLIYDKGGNHDSDSILKLYQENFGIGVVQSDQIKACLSRLKSNGKIEIKDSKIAISKNALTSLENSNVNLNDFTESLLDDIINRVLEVSKRDISKVEKMHIRKNSIEVLLELFKLYGLELSNQIIGQGAAKAQVDFDQFAKIASSGLNKEMGTLVVAVIGNLMANPNERQAKTLATWAKAYLGIKLMNLDPSLKEFELTQFGSKIFLLDTDFLLHCIIKEHPLHSPSIKLVNALIKSNCQVIIPDKVFDEVLLHIEGAHRTWKVFGDTLFQFTDEMIENAVGNVVVKGYFYSQQERNDSFSKYWSFYYNDIAPRQYLRDIIYDILPKNVIIKKIADFNVEIPKEIFEKFSNTLMDISKSSINNKYRTPEETEELAKTDANLFLTCYYLNIGDKDRILGGKAYLITNAYRYFRCCKTIGIQDIVTARPNTLLAILDTLGRAEISSSELVKMMYNPLLAYSIEKSWDDIQLLVRSGVQLTGIPITKLKWDLQLALHDQIAAYKELNSQNEKETDEESFDKTDRFFQLIDKTDQLGYSKLPQLTNLMNEINDKKEEVEGYKAKYQNLQAEYDSLKTEVDRFEKRKHLYIVKKRKR